MRADGSHRGLEACSANNQTGDQALFPADNSVGARVDGLPIDPPVALAADGAADSHSHYSRSAAWTSSVAGSSAVACSASENSVVAAAPVEPAAEPIAELAVNSADGLDDSVAAEPRHVNPHFRPTTQRLSAWPPSIQVGIDSSRVNLSLYSRLARGANPSICINRPGSYIWWSLSSSESAESTGGGNSFNGSKFASES
jgi:hypothetical protein